MNPAGPGLLRHPPLARERPASNAGGSGRAHAVAERLCARLRTGRIRGDQVPAHDPAGTATDGAGQAVE